MKYNVNLHNEFDFVAIDTITNTEKTYKAYNLITNTGLTAARTGGAFSSYIAVGTGTGTPAVADTKLFTWAAAKAVAVETRTFDTTTNTYTVRFSITFNETEQNGKILRKLV